MKNILTALLLGTLVASPAFAQAATRHHQAPTYSDQWDNSYAQVPMSTDPHLNSVYTDGQYRGTDPDPEVRFDLRREVPADRGGD